MKTNRRVVILIAFASMFSLGCVGCGGVGNQQKNNQQVKLEPKPDDAAAPVKAEPKTDTAAPGGAKVKAKTNAAKSKSAAYTAQTEITAYDVFPEVHKSQLVRDWKMALEAVRRAIDAEKSALNRTTTSAEREKHARSVAIYTGRLARLESNNPLYVTKETADSVAKYREETNDKEIADARLKRKTEAEAVSQAEEKRLKETYEDKLKQYQLEKEMYDKAATVYKAGKAEAEAAKLLNLARMFDNDKERNVARRRFREIIETYPNTQAAKDAKELLNGGYVSPRKTPAMPLAPSSPTKPRLPQPVNVVYPPDPVSHALADAARKSDAAMARDAVALREAEYDAARRAEEEYEVAGLVLLRSTQKGLTRDIGGEITGTVVNRRDHTLRYAEIRFNLYDETGAQVGTALANVNTLEAGGRWSFKAVTFNNRWKSFKCVGLSGF